ncbi:MAG: sodium-dependent transporter [Phycisphaerae bacterium]|jgi:NSS family neurotransmitter:Na+ symporter
MAELLTEQRESWGTRSGFILAAVGSAVGLGNLWGFPFKVYDNGGAAFLIPYIIAMFVVGLPIMILEFSLGHFTQRAAPEAFATANKKLEFLGWWGILMGFVIIAFYPVVLGYCFSFMWFSIKGIFNGGELPWAGQGMQGVENAKEFFYTTYLNSHSSMSLGAIQWNIVVPLVIAWATMYLCIFRGVKLVGKVVWLTVPLPWLILAILTVNGLMLKGSYEGLAYYLVPDWSKLLDTATWQSAFGQAFFSLSLAFGVMITYASFLHRKSDLNNNASIIVIADFATSFVAGLAVFTTLGAMSYVTSQAGSAVSVEQVAQGGPGLAFVAFPYALAQLPGSAWWSFLFFFTLVTLGIDSAFSITESVLASLVDKTGWRRGIVLPVLSAAGLGFGFIFATQGGLNWLGVVSDFIYGTRGSAFIGLLECIIIGWFWRVDYLRRHANIRSDWQLGRIWDYSIRIIIPVILSTLFIWSLYNDLTRESGFLIGATGKWIITDCVGISILILTFAVSVVLSLVKSSSNRAHVHKPKDLGAGGVMLSLAAFILSIVCVRVLIHLLVEAHRGNQNSVLLWVSLGGAAAAVWLSNEILNRYNREHTEASWLARWGGMIGTVGVGGFIAVILIYNTSGKTKTITKVPVYEIVAVFLVLVVLGISWCFYRALHRPPSPYEPQLPEEIGDERQAGQ